MINFSNLLNFKQDKEGENLAIEETGGETTTNFSHTSWIKCASCQSMMYFKEVLDKHSVCPKCNHHMTMLIEDRIKLLCDEGSFVEYDSELRANDPLEFVDKVSYKQRLQKGFDKNGKNSSVISGSCTINGIDAQMVLFDFSFMGGSLGSVEGEKIVRAVNRAIENEQGLIILSTSGGARMQESTFALLQMAKSAAALKRLC